MYAEISRFKRLATYVTLCIIVVLSDGCAFDISHVRRVPTSFEPATTSGPGWILLENRSIGVGSGFPTRLKAQTRWSLSGRVPEGDVYRTRDQIVTVEASSIFEAMPVMRQRKLVGFYLPGERSLVPVDPPVILPIADGDKS